MRILLGLLLAVLITSSNASAETKGRGSDLDAMEAHFTCRFTKGEYFVLRGNDIFLSRDQDGLNDPEADAVFVYSIYPTSMEACYQLEQDKKILAYGLSRFDSFKEMDLKGAMKSIDKLTSTLNDPKWPIIANINETFGKKWPRLYPHIRKVQISFIVSYNN